MKATADNIANLRAALSPLDTPENREAYRSGAFPRSDAVKDLDRRYRWDLYWASGSREALAMYDAGCNDTHIDTALKSIVPPIVR